MIPDKRTALIFTFALLLTPALAFGGFTYQRVPTVDEIETASGLANVLTRVSDWIFTFLLILAVIFILYAAFKYLTAQGNPADIAVANKMLLYAAIAVAVAVLSKSLVVLVRSFVGSGAGGGGGGGIPPPPGGTIPA